MKEQGAEVSSRGFVSALRRGRCDVSMGDAMSHALPHIWNTEPMPPGRHFPESTAKKYIGENFPMGAFQAQCAHLPLARQSPEQEPA